MKFPWRGILGLALSIALLWLAFRGVHWSDVVENLRRANLWLVLLSVAIATMVFPLRAIRWFEIFSRRVAPQFEERGRRLLHSFAEGLSVLRHPRRFAVVFSWALALWLVQPLAFVIMFRALGIDTVGFWAALFVQGLIVL